MKKTHADMPSDQLRAIIENCGLSRYELSKRAGLQQSALSRFMAGTVGLSLDSLDRLAPVLGLSITSKRPKTRKGR